MIESFISNFANALADTEVPELYSVWTGIAGVSALLGRRVWLNVGRLRLYPNTCIVLIAASGQRKSTPLVVLKDDIFLRLPPELRPNLIPQEITPQHLVQIMNSKPRTSNGDNLLDEPVCEGFGIFDELGTFLGSGAYDGGLPALLIDLIDCRTYDKGTIMRGVERIPNPCFGFIGGTTVEHIRRVIPEGSIGEGLTSRFIFVHVEGKTKDVPFPPEIPPATIAALLKEAVRLSQLTGEITFAADVFAAHVIEYKRFRGHSPFWSNSHLIGYANRRDKHLMKVAMLLAVASGSATVQLGHYEGALALLYKSENIMQRMVQKITSSAEGGKTEMVMDLITRAGGVVSRTQLLRNVVHMMNSRELSEVLVSLRDSGQVINHSNGKDTYYEVKPKE